MNKHIIEKAAASLQNEAVDSLCRLVNINSFSGNPDDLDQAARLIKDIAEHLDLPLAPVRPPADSKNLYHLIYDGRPPNGRPFFGILGHFDTVHRPDSHFNALLNQYLQAAAEFNLNLCDRSSGGGSDANFTAAMGIPTLDSLGPEGGGAHTDHEYINAKSLHDSINVFALFLANLIAS